MRLLLGKKGLKKKGKKKKILCKDPTDSSISFVVSKEGAGEAKWPKMATRKVMLSSSYTCSSVIAPKQQADAAQEKSAWQC